VHISPVTIEVLAVDITRALDAIDVASLVVVPLNLQPLSRSNP